MKDNVVKTNDDNDKVIIDYIYNEIFGGDIYGDFSDDIREYREFCKNFKIMKSLGYTFEWVKREDGVCVRKIVKDEEKTHKEKTYKTKGINEIDR